MRVFAEPWEARAFAMVRALQDAGLLTPAEWTEALAARGPVRSGFPAPPIPPIVTGSAPWKGLSPQRIWRRRTPFQHAAQRGLARPAAPRTETPSNCGPTTSTVEPGGYVRAHHRYSPVITGCLTDVYCESTARDGMMLNYKVIMVTDANAADTDADHNAALTAFYSTFGDVMSTEVLVDRLA